MSTSTTTRPTDPTVPGEIDIDAFYIARINDLIREDRTDLVAELAAEAAEFAHAAR